MIKSITKRRLVKASAIAAVATAAVGLLHVPLARSLGAGCPFDPEAVARTPEQRDVLRAAATARLRGEQPASGKPALGFTLGATTRSELEQWATEHGASCVPGRDETGLMCTGAQWDGASGTLHADFDASWHLVAVTLTARTPTAGAASAAWRSRRAALDGALGEPTRVAGDSSSTYLGEATLRQSRVEYRRADYYASVTATNLQPDGYLLSQVYRALD